MFFDADETLEALYEVRTPRPLPRASTSVERTIVALAVIWAGKKVLGK